MREGIDFSTLTTSERVIVLAGGLLFFNGFVPWWYRLITSEGTVTFNAGLTGLSVTAVVAGAIAAVGVIARAWIWPAPAPEKDGTLYAVLGALALLCLVAQIVRRPAEWLGLYAGVVLAVVILLAGLRRRLERRRGWT